MNALSKFGLCTAVGAAALSASVQSAEINSLLRGNPDHEGFYITGSGGWQAREKSTDIGLGTAAEFKDGFLLNGGVGYRFPFNIRAEVEAGYQNNKNKAFLNESSVLFAVGSNAPGLPIGSQDQSVGNVGLRSFMVNLYYDIPLGPDSKWKPYIGGGVGTYQSTINGFTSPTLSANGIAISTSSRETFAWQLRAGLAYRVIERAELFGGYRYFHGDDLKFTFYVPGGAFGGFPGAIPPQGAQLPLNVTGGITHGAEFGFRFFF
jgi:opacity protein-like surface antigen